MSKTIQGQIGVHTPTRKHHKFDTAQHIEKEFFMAKIIRYFSHRAGRGQAIKVLGWFSVVGAAFVSTVLLVDTFLR
jgi:hypothetical protein